MTLWTKRRSHEVWWWLKAHFHLQATQHSSHIIERDSVMGNIMVEVRFEDINY